MTPDKKKNYKKKKNNNNNHDPFQELRISSQIISHSRRFLATGTQTFSVIVILLSAPVSVK